MNKIQLDIYFKNKKYERMFHNGIIEGYMIINILIFEEFDNELKFII